MAVPKFFEFFGIFLSALSDGYMHKAQEVRTYIAEKMQITDRDLSEMLPSRLGWNCTALEDEIIRGYADEMKDFMECIYYDREPHSNFSVARDTIKIIYSAYKSAEIGHNVKIA